MHFIIVMIIGETDTLKEIVVCNLIYIFHECLNLNVK